MAIYYLAVIVGAVLIVFSNPIASLVGRATSLDDNKGILHFLRFMVLSAGALLALTALQQVLGHR